jgi:signal recognition particle subunit SRP54
MVRKMGSISSILGMIPGMDKMAAKVDPEKAEKEMKRVEAIILSMTFKERVTPAIIDGSRRKRIAKGSGTSVEEVNKLLRQFLEMKKMMKGMSKHLGKLGKLGGGPGGGMLNPMNLLGMKR